MLALPAVIKNSMQKRIPKNEFYNFISCHFRFIFTLGVIWKWRLGKLTMCTP